MAYGQTKLDPDDLIGSCDNYLGEREGRYEWRCVRYDAAINAMFGHGLNDTSTVIDVGAGWTELAARLYERAFYSPGYDVGPKTYARPRYFPVDGCLDGTNLENWVPPRQADFIIALELIEHLHQPVRLIKAMQQYATRAVIVSTPNAETTDVLGMDADHKTPFVQEDLERLGFQVWPSRFYGNDRDSLFGVWTPGS